MAPSTAAPAQPIPVTRFDLEQAREEDRFLLWKESIAVIFDVSLEEPGAERSFKSELTTCHLGSLLFSNSVSCAQLFRRGRKLIAQDGLDHFLLQIYRRGTNVGTCGKRALDAAPGDLFLLDLGQPIETRADDYDNLTLVIPRPLLTRHLREPERLHGRRLPGNSPLGGLLREHLGALWSRIPEITSVQAQAVADGLLPLVAAYFTGHEPVEESAEIQTATRETIRHYIARNLSDPRLSPQSLARTFRISRASLYRLFEPLGGLANHIREQRLRLCMHLLTDPAHRRRRIGDIALSAGFTDEAHFSRIFRRSFGITARDAREGAPLGDHPSSATPAEIDRRYEEWLRTLLSASTIDRNP